MYLFLFIFILCNIAIAQLQVKESDLIAIYGERGSIIYAELEEYTTYNSGDVLIGSLCSSISGLGQGFMESRNFGYEWKAIGYSSWLSDWYRRNTSGDGIFAKTFDFNKVNRTIDYTFDRLAYKKLERFYGDKWYSPILVYFHNFLVKNTTASIIRAWCKYDQPFRDFSGWQFDLDYIINRLFIER